MAARYSTVLFALATLASAGAQAALFTGSDSRSGLVAEYPYLQPGKPCLKTMCALDRTLSPGASGPVTRVVLTVSLEQSAFHDPNFAYDAIFLRHGGPQLLMTPIGAAAVSGGPITLTFDDAAPNERPPAGFQVSGTYHPTEDHLSDFIGRSAEGPWVLTVIEYHEAAGFIRYVDSSIQVWADAPVLGVPEPGTWAMMVAGLVSLGFGFRPQASRLRAAAAARAQG